MVRILLCLAVCITAAKFSIAQDSGIFIVLEEQTLLIDSAHQIGGFAYVFREGNTRLTLADAKAKFQNDQLDKLNKFYSTYPDVGTYWISFFLENRGDESNEVVFYLGREHDATIYGADEDQRVGTFVKSNEKRGALPKGVLLGEDGYSGQLMIRLKAGQRSQIFVKTTRKRTITFPFNFKLYHPKTWKKDTAFGNRNFIQGVGQGILWTLILYHLILFVILRDPIYIYYCLYSFWISVFTLGEFGYIHEIFLPNQPVIAKFFILASVFGAIIMVFIFMLDFVQLKRLLPQWDKRIKMIIKVVSFFVILFYFVLFVAYSFLQYDDYRIIVYSYYFSIPILLFALYFATVLIKTKDKIAQYFAWTGLFFVIGLIVNILWTIFINRGDIQDTTYLRYYLSKAIGLVHLLTFAVGLGYRRQQKDTEVHRMNELDKMKSHFFANISHEFRTPLTLIIGPLKQLMAVEQEPEKLQQYELIYQNSERLLRLINEMLSLSELEMGKMQLQAKHQDINAFVRSFTLSFESLADIKNIKLKLDTPENELNCWFDIDKLEKILGNILSNAFKFTPEDGVITVSLKRSKDDKKVIVAVRDSGPGIEKALLSQVFDRYFYVNNKTADGQLGTGIGLSLAKELVLLHHGEISVESQLGHGACFRFSLLLGEKHLEEKEKANRLIAEQQNYTFEEQLQAQTEMSVSPSPVFEKGEGVPQLLLVEDNTEVRIYVKSYLSPHYRIIEAEDGRLGFDLATDKIPDIIVSDVMMPNMDGNELCDKLKNDEKTSHIPIILLTARSAKTDKIQGLKLGADAYLTKPFDKEELLVQIANLLKNRERLKLKFAQGELLEPEIPELPDRDRAFLNKINAVIESHLDDQDFGVEELLAAMLMSRTQLHRKLKAITNQSTTQYIRGIRLEHARKLLQSGDYNVTETAFRVGFNSQTYFSKSFKEYFGFPPSDLA